MDRYSCVSFGYRALESHTSPFNIFKKPPLPPKSIDRFANSSRTFGFSSKASFVSFASLQGSSVSLLRGSKSSTEPASNPCIFDRSTDGETVTHLQILQSSDVPKFRYFLNYDLVRVSLIYDKNLMDRTWYYRHIVPFCPPVSPLPTKEHSEDDFQYVEGPAPAIFTPPPARKEKGDKGNKKAKGHLLLPGHFPRPPLALAQPPFLGRTRRQLSIGGPPKTVLGGPARKLSCFSSTTFLTALWSLAFASSYEHHSVCINYMDLAKGLDTDTGILFPTQPLSSPTRHLPLAAQTEWWKMSLAGPVR